MSTTTSAPRTAGTNARGRFPNAVSHFGVRLWSHWNNVRPFSPPARSEWPRAMRHARLIGLALLGVQFLALIYWSHVLVSRFALTRDFSSWAQATYLIAHGHLDPYSTTLGHPFWHDHAEFAAWPLAALVRLWPNALVLSIAQDAAAVGACAVAFGWVCEIAAARSHVNKRQAVALMLCAALMLVVNPWVVWTCSFDIHLEAFATLFLLTAARDLYRGKRRAWIWLAIALGEGDISATYAVGLGLSAAIYGRAFWKKGIFIAVLSLAWLMFLAHVHGTSGSPTGEYAGVLGTAGNSSQPTTAVTLSIAIVEHPLRDAKALWVNIVDEWANVAPTGIIGWLWPPALLTSLIVLLEGGLSHGGMNFALPGFQNVAIVPFSVLGAGAMLAWTFQRRSSAMRRVGWIALVALSANAVVWGAIWIPAAVRSWLLVSPAAAKDLAAVRAKIQPGDEVVASQGVVGGFADHAFEYPVMGPNTDVPVRARRIWFIITPRQGVETILPSAAYADIAQLNGMSHVKMVSDADGVWAFEWTPPKGVKNLLLHPKSTEVPAYTVAGQVGTRIMSGPSKLWYSSSNGTAGYVIDHAYWRLHPGTFTAFASMSVTGVAEFEVWDSDTHRLLSRMSVPDTDGRTKIEAPFQLTSAPGAGLFEGWGIWRMQLTPPSGDQIEVRIWDAGGANQVTVYRVGVQAANSGAEDAATGASSG